MKTQLDVYTAELRQQEDQLQQKAAFEVGFEHAYPRFNPATCNCASASPPAAHSSQGIGTGTALRLCL